MGFFTKKEIQSENLHLSNRKLSCYACGLYKGDIESPKMQPFGKFKKGILNIGDFTTRIDDIGGKPFRGKGKMLYTIFSSLGIDIEEDCLNVNSVMCFPYDKKTGRDRDPSQHEIDCCRINMMKIIKQYKPKLIILFGKVALNSIISVRWKDVGVLDKWRGFVIPDQEYGCWVAPVFSPAYVSMYDRPEVDLIWKADIKNALQHVEQPFPAHQKPKITVLQDLDVLSTIPNHSIVSFDYETTGLKPHDKGHKIVCASVAINENEVYTFPMPNEIEKRKPFIELLKNRLIKKMAHNIKFEETWSIIRLNKTRVKNWYWDTMINAHILDNRSGITSLKFQTYINFGVGDYSSHMKSILEGSDDKNANSKNKLVEFFSTPKGQTETLEYCALDSIFQYRLYLKQKEFVDHILPF